MIFWVDAQLPPSFARWLTQAFGVEAYSLRYIGLHTAEDGDTFDRARRAGDVVLISKDSDFIELIEQRGTPPRMLWVTCGNLTNRRLREVFGSLFIDAIALLEAGEQIVELGDA